MESETENENIFPIEQSLKLSCLEFAVRLLEHRISSSRSPEEALSVAQTFYQWFQA